MRTAGCGFHHAFALFRNAGIFHGVGERAKAGAEAAANAAGTGRLGAVYLRRAIDVIAGRHGAVEGFLDPAEPG